VVVITADQRDESQCDILIRDFILPAFSEEAALLGAAQESAEASL
jgi:hypothetical protein